MEHTFDGVDYGGGSFPFPERQVSLYSMLASVGYSRETSAEYDWHGLKRGSKEFALFQFTLSGRGKLRVKNTEYDVTPGKGMAIYFPADNQYWLPEDSDHWEFVYAVLYGREIWRLWRHVSDACSALVDIDPLGPSMQALRTIYDAGNSDALRTPFQASTLAYNLVMAVMHEVYPTSLSSSRGPVAKALEYCENHYHQPIGVEDLAKAAGLSRYHFTRLFKQAEGMTPAQYILHVRLRSALSQLRDTQDSVKSIALDCGFKDANYFCKVFRKSQGMSPGEFRHNGMFYQSRTP